MKYADKIPGLDERTSGLLKGAAGLLAPKGGTTNNPAGTNPPAGGVLDFLKRPKTK
jgi:hypothetical protein